MNINKNQNIKLIIIPLVANLIFIIAYIVAIPATWTPITKNISKYNSYELSQLYVDNQSDFQEVAQILLNNEAFFERCKTGRSFAVISARNVLCKQYFSAEDWKKISQFQPRAAHLASAAPTAFFASSAFGAWGGVVPTVFL